MSAEIVGFLQCRYLRAGLRKHPAFAKPGAMDNRHPYGKALWARMLFTSQTGKVLRRHLGDEICDATEWDNASPEIGQCSSASFPADPTYIFRVLKEEGWPPIVLTFGTVARAGVRAALSMDLEHNCYSPTVIHATHPACRLYPGAALDSMRRAIVAARATA